MESTHSRRRLTTILAADVVSYSKLMAEDEDATVRTLRAHREVIDRLIARHDGRIFNTGGDSVLAEFGSAVEAVRCAITIQDELRTRNAELVEGRRLLLRIGINVGDVIVQGTDLLGDGVNVAARLEGIAEPGGVCISGSTFEQVKNKLSVGFASLGPQHVKNIPEPVAAFSITSAPVRVSAESEARRGSAATARRRRWLPAASAAVVVVVAAVGGVLFWQLSRPSPRALSAFPENIATPDMSAGEIAALVAGMTISGKRATDGEPFEIRLNPDRSLDYSFSGSGDLSGMTIREVGKWRAEDAMFCLQVVKFAMGREICPQIVKQGNALFAVRPVNGTTLPWTLSK